MPSPDKAGCSRRNSLSSSWIAIAAGAGTALGAGLGTSVGSIAIGAGIGTALGTAVGTALVLAAQRNRGS
jgi:hypothetical protein